MVGTSGSLWDAIADPAPLPAVTPTRAAAADGEELLPRTGADGDGGGAPTGRLSVW